MSIYTRYLELYKAAKDIEAEMADIKTTIMEQITDEWFESPEGNIKKVRKMMPKLKEGVAITDIMEKCPEWVKYSADTKWLSSNAAWHEFVEFEESSYIMVTKWKA